MADARSAPERSVVERAALSFGATIALTGRTRIDQARVDCAHILDIQVHSIPAVGQEIGHEHVGRREQLIEHCSRPAVVATSSVTDRLLRLSCSHMNDKSSSRSGSPATGLPRIGSAKLG